MKDGLTHGFERHEANADTAMAQVIAPIGTWAFGRLNTKRFQDRGSR